MCMSEMRETSYKVIICRIDEYKRVKKMLNLGKHPTFIGQNLFYGAALNGGAFIFQLNSQDIAVSLVNTRKNILLVLNVLPKYRSLGVGKWILNFIKPNFARVLETTIPYFEKNGYIAIGVLKSGRSLNTQIMVKSNLIDLSGRLRKILIGRKP